MMALDDRPYRVPLDRVAAQEDGDTVVALASLTDTEREALLQTFSIEITFDGARAFAFHHTAGILKEMDRSIFLAVVRDCR